MPFLSCEKNSGLTTRHTAALLQTHVPVIFNLLSNIAQDMNRSEALMRAAMGVVGDLADAFPNGELVDAFRQEWLTAMIKEVRSSRDFAPRTVDTARWAREQVKRQPGGGAQGVVQPQS